MKTSKELEARLLELKRRETYLESELSDVQDEIEDVEDELEAREIEEVGGFIPCSRCKSELTPRDANGAGDWVCSQCGNCMTLAERTEYFNNREFIELLESLTPAHT